MPPLIHTMRHCLLQAQFFFRRSRLFVLFHPTKPTASKTHIRYSIYSVYSVYSIYSIYPHQNKQHSLLVLPFVNAILNFATKFFEMFTKKQSRHPHQVFQVFQVFHFDFGPENRPILVQIGTKQVFQVFQAFRILTPFLSGRGRG